MEKQKVKVLNKSGNELPSYAKEGDAGFDIRADFTGKEKTEDFIGEDFRFNPETRDLILLARGGRVLIPSGLHIRLPDGYELQIRPRSGLALKHGISMVNTPGTIDCFSETSYIKTIDGDKQIKDLHINDIVLSVNEETLEIEKDIITAIVNTNVQEIIQFETTDGILEITPNTIVYTKNGVKKAHELNIDDEILSF